MESSMAMLRLGGLLTTLILLSVSTLGKVAESKVVAVRSRPSCIDEARESLNRTNDPDNATVTGSYARYRDVEHPKDVAIVQDIVKSGVVLYRQQENDLREFWLVVAPEQMEAYKKSVYGDTYCVQFTVTVIQCSNAGLAAGDCIIKKRTTCSLSAHKDVNAEKAAIDPETLDCTAAAA